MKSRWFRVMAAILGLVLLFGLFVPVVAATPTVDLVLGGSGAIPWTISNVAPGNSGTSTVTLSNTGSQNGVVSIWISTIIEGEGVNPESETGDTAEPGELGNYLLLNVSGTNLSANFALPAKIHDFPQSAIDTRHIYVNPLNGNTTLTLQWQWRLPPETGNDVQGDTLSFTINYVLEESHPITPAPVPPQGGGGIGLPNNSENISGFVPQPPVFLQFVSADGIITFDLLANGSTANLYVAVFFENKLTLQIDPNTVTTFSSWTSPEGIDVSIAPVGPSPSDNRQIVSLIYQISAGYDADGNYQEVSFSRPVTIILRYDPAAVPLNATSLYIATIGGDPNQPSSDWVRLDQSPGISGGTGIVSGLITHLSRFAVMADLPSSTPPPPEPSPPQATPANFEVRNLTVDPVQVKQGESISINCEVINNSSRSGEYTLMINIPGMLQTSQLIKLEAGQTQAISLTLPPGAPGTYQVDIGGVKGSFTIEALSPALSGKQKISNAWLIPAILALISAAGLIYYAVILMIRRQRNRR
jgi:hypothetical protein